MRAFEAKVKAIEREGARIWTAGPPPQQIRSKSDGLLGMGRDGLRFCHDPQGDGCTHHDLGSPVPIPHRLSPNYQRMTDLGIE